MQKFLDALASKGGNIFLLAVFVVSLLLLVIWITSRDAGDSQAVTVILSTFSAFSGALLAALTGAGSNQRKTDQPPEQPK